MFVAELSFYLTGNLFIEIFSFPSLGVTDFLVPTLHCPHALDSLTVAEFADCVHESWLPFVPG